MTAYKNSIPEPKTKDIKRFFSKVNKTTPDSCWDWKGCKDRNGYGAFSLRHKRFFAHRVSYLIYHKIDPLKLKVCHKCDNPPCVNPNHLFLGTDAENVADRVRKGRPGARESSPETTARGAKIGSSKLNDDKVTSILSKLKAGESIKKVAKEFGVSFSTIYGISTNIQWKHVPRP